MPRSASLNPAGSLWHLIAVEVRRQRELEQISGVALADFLDVDRSTVSRVESGDIRLTTKHAKAMDARWDLRDLLTNLVAHAKAGLDTDYWETYLEYERRALLIKLYASSLVPGILQTEGYARDLFVASRRTDVDQALEARLARRETLTSDNPPVLQVLLDTAAVERMPADVELAREQLDYLINLSEQPHALVRIVGSRPGLYGGAGSPFTIVQTKAGELALSSSRTGGSITIDPDDLQALRLEFDVIGTEALTCADSRQYLKEVRDRLT